jgi:hypothetical protein
LPLDDPGFDASIVTDFRQRELAAALGAGVAWLSLFNYARGKS